MVVQWLGIRLPMQGIWVWSLVRGHLPCGLRAATTEPVLCNKKSHCNEKAAHGLQLEKVHTQQRKPTVTKKKKNQRSMQSLFSVSFFVLSVADLLSCFVVFSIFMDWIVFPPKRYIIAVTPGVSECDLIWKRGCCWCIQFAATAAKPLQSCLTLCDPIDGSPPGSPVPGILKARTLEWVAISISNAWKWKVKVKSLSRVRLYVTPYMAAHQGPPSLGFSRQEHWSGLLFPSPLADRTLSNCI